MNKTTKTNNTKVAKSTNTKVAKSTNTKVAKSTTNTKVATTNNEKSNIVFSFRGVNSIGSVVVASFGLKQLTNTSHDATQLILSGKSSLNLRKKTCFINATNTDYELFKNDTRVNCIENGNVVDGIRPHRIEFNFTELENVCKVLAKNKLNCNGFEIV